MTQKLLPLQATDALTEGLNVVYAQFQESCPFSFELFEGFSSLRVLTYSVSIPMTVRMLNLFEMVECVFGYEGILHDFGDILACQKVLSESILMAVKGLDDERKGFILDKTARGLAKFYVVKDAIAHSKIYLLEGDGRKRVIVGSANLSERAFSGKQAETLVVFDNDENAWSHYEGEYRSVKDSATNQFTLPDLAKTEVSLEDIPLVREAQTSENKMTLYVNADTTKATIPQVTKRVEKLAENINAAAKPLIKPQGGKFQLDRRVIGQIIQLVRNQKTKEAVEEPRWLSINLDARTVLLSGKEVLLEADPAEIKSDVRYIIEYFENFKKGFHGDVEKLQKDYFMFMSWFYFSPFVCDLRNRALVEYDFIFDYPMFAVLYGKSNCGKTTLIQTLMKSMFGQWDFVDKANFTGTNLRGLLFSKRRFPVVFDDIDRNRFTDHAGAVIKDETFMSEEYPTFVLSMNADNQAFSTEIFKRCLMLYTSSSLPDQGELMRDLFRSVTSIQNKISTALYRTYLGRVLEKMATEALPRDLLQFSSLMLISIFREYYDGPLPSWCTPMSINNYQGRKYEKVQADLKKLYEASPSLWEIKKEEIILRPPERESFTLRRDIPDWLLRPGSKAGNIVLDRKELVTFLDMSFKRKWYRWFRR